MVVDSPRARSTVNHSNLPQDTRDLLEAAELKAQMILEECERHSHWLEELACEAGVDPYDIGFSPGRPALEAARSLARTCQPKAAAYLFESAAQVYWQQVLAPDVQAFVEQLDSLWHWAYGKFELRWSIPEDTKRSWRIWALQSRASAAATQVSQPAEALGKKGMPLRIRPRKARRGYRHEVRAWMKKEGIATVQVAAERLNVGYDILKSIMSDRGNKRYGNDTLAFVLEKIGFKE
jgi:hypothetical protein